MIVFRTGFLCVVVFLLGCARQESQPLAAPQTFRSAIILIPGYYGSRLVLPGNGKVIWISAAQALFGHQSLILPVPGLGLHDAIELVPDGILDRVQVIPWLYAVDGYGSMLKALQAYGEHRSMVVPLSYDWRGDLTSAVQQLDDVIGRLKNDGITEIDIVAHSMGGLIAAYYLRYGGQEPDHARETWEGARQIRRAVLAGVPFEGTMIAFRNSQEGVQIGLNRTLLQPLAVSSFPATYFLLPVRDQDVLLTPSLQRITGPVHDASNWTTERWGLLKTNGLDEESMAHRQAYTTAWLARGQKFLSRVLAPAQVGSPSQIPLLSIVGTGEETLATGVWSAAGRGGNGSLAFDQGTLANVLSSQDVALLFRDGDGSVTSDSASLPTAYANGLQAMVRSYRVGHAEMMRRSDIQVAIVQFLHTAGSESLWNR